MANNNATKKACYRRATAHGRSLPPTPKKPATDGANLFNLIYPREHGGGPPTRNLGACMLSHPSTPLFRMYISRATVVIVSSQRRTLLTTAALGAASAARGTSLSSSSSGGGGGGSSSSQGSKDPVLQGPTSPASSRSSSHRRSDKHAEIDDGCAARAPHPPCAHLIHPSSPTHRSSIPDCPCTCMAPASSYPSPPFHHLTLKPPSRAQRSQWGKQPARRGRSQIVRRCRRRCRRRRRVRRYRHHSGRCRCQAIAVATARTPLATTAFCRHRH